MKLNIGKGKGGLWFDSSQNFSITNTGSPITSSKKNLVGSIFANVLFFYQMTNESVGEYSS